MSKSNKLDALGGKSNVPVRPDKNVLEKIPNPKIGINYSIRLTCPEFTSICPVTSQPDFAYIIIDYVPDKFIVESKSFKLYLLAIEIMVPFTCLPKNIDRDTSPRVPISANS